jgi:NAD-dependent DNA ligase
VLLKSGLTIEQAMKHLKKDELHTFEQSQVDDPKYDKLMSDLVAQEKEAIEKKKQAYKLKK